jgi:uncharacterized protein YjgD (DUF1641 family)
MDREQLILDRLERIEAQLAPLSESARSWAELKEDIRPLVNPACRSLVRELGTMETRFQLEDLFRLIKTTLKNTRNLTYLLDTLESATDFALTVEPLLKSAIPVLIHYLDELEQRGVFRIIEAMLGVRAKLASAYSPEDIDQIGDGLVVLFGLAKKLGHPRTRAFIETMTDFPSEVDWTQCKPVGPIGLISAIRCSEVQDGLGVFVEFTKAIAKVKLMKNGTTEQ